ncbi:MAG TPA: ABC transporter permease [Streptosporangiaceae bacterium]|nr:ABC transporter permease [Streptosporangiaceae bacterium]
MRAAVLICGKDLKARLRDRSALLIGIVVPLGLAFIFNSIFSGISGNSAAIDLGVVNADRGVVAQQFVSRVLGAVGASGLIAVRSEATASSARALVAQGTLNAVIIIPAGFSARVQAGRPASMQVIGNVDSPISSEIARSIAESYAADLNRVRLSVAAVLGSGGRPASPGRIRALGARAAAAAAPVAVRDVSATSKELDQKSFFAAGMAVFFLFFTVQFGVTSLLEERNDGTLARLVAAPISKASILGGKLLTSFLLGALSMTVLAVATTLLFGASWGNPLGVAVLIVAAIGSAMGIMALVATVARNAEQAGNWQSVVAVVLGLLGGTFFPVSRAPGILSDLTFAAPQAWFLRGLGDLRGGSISVVWVPALAMCGFAIVTGGIAMTRLRHLAEV